MCLKIKSTKASDLFGNKEKITCWKTLSSSGTSIYWGTKYYLGENTSNRINTELSFHEETVKLVNNGIHVFTDKTFATKDRYNSEIVVAVTCHKKDFIAIGEFGDAVFYKVYLSRRQVAKFCKQEDL